MPLVSSTTNLKSLKYKTYTDPPYVITQIPDAPESNGYQLISGLPPLGGLGGNVTDFFRGGFGLPRAIVQDEVRVGKFLASPQGLLFIGKQELLSRIGVREQNTRGALNDGLYNPLSTLASVAGIGEGIYFNKQTQRTYLEKLGSEFEIGNVGGADYDVNRLAQLYNSKILNGLANNNKSLTISPFDNQILSYTGGPGAELGIGNTIIPFAGNPGGGYLRTGLNNPNTKKYLYVETPLTSTQNPINPGLIYISSTSGMGNIAMQNAFLAQSLNQPEPAATPTSTPPIWDLRLDGKDNNSVSTLLFNPESVIAPAPVLNLNRIVGNFGVSRQYVLAKGALLPQGTGENIQVFDATYNAISEADGTSTSTNALPYNNLGPNSNGVLTYTQDQLIGVSNDSASFASTTTGYSTYGATLRDFRKDLHASLPKDANGKLLSNTIAAAPNYTEKNIEKRVNLGDPGSSFYNRFDYSKGVDYSNNGKPVKALDTITAFPIYRASNVAADSTDVGGALNDLVKFRVAAIDNDNPSLKDFMHFRAFLNSFTDNYNPEWAAQKYVGRGDSLYRYAGFTRQVNLSWTVVAQSVQELLPMYKKLNYLAGNTMPDYSPQGYMRAPLVELTVGAYLFDQPGFINSLTYTANFDAGWEIGIGSDGESYQTTPDRAASSNNPGVFELPKMIDVSMTFTPIPEFLPRKPVGKLFTANQPQSGNWSTYKNKHANQRDINFKPDSPSGLTPKGYLVYQRENYIALTREGNTFGNY